jgi:hypothetical protein
MLENIDENIDREVTATITVSEDSRAVVTARTRLPSFNNVPPIVLWSTVTVTLLQDDTENSFVYAFASDFTWIGAFQTQSIGFWGWKSGEPWDVYADSKKLETEQQIAVDTLVEVGDRTNLIVLQTCNSPSNTIRTLMT